MPALLRQDPHAPLRALFAGTPIHVILFDDPTKEIAAEIVRCPGAWEKVLVGLDFFDASINRIGAWVTGCRAMEKSLLYALLQPNDQLKELQDEYRFTEKMMLAEAAKSMPSAPYGMNTARAKGCRPILSATLKWHVTKNRSPQSASRKEP